MRWFLGQARSSARPARPRGSLFLLIVVLLAGARIAVPGQPHSRREANPAPSPSNSKPLQTGPPHEQGQAVRPSNSKPLQIGPPLRHGQAGRPPTLYLTFDDGPEPPYTPEVLAVLAAHKVPATFFVVGSNVRKHPDLVRSVAAAGHSVQNHTLSHADLTRLSAAAKTAEIAEGARAIRDATGREPRCLRPPYGYLDAATVQRTREMGVQLVLWDLDPQDWADPGAAQIVRRVLASAHPGSIMLLHDGGKDRRQTVAALRQFLPVLLQRGYRFAALCQ